MQILQLDRKLCSVYTARQSEFSAYTQVAVLTPSAEQLVCMNA